MPVNMKVYPPWWVADVTLYNRFEDANGLASWYKTQLSGCYYSNPKLTQTSRTYESDKRDADSYICRIREDARYRPPSVWTALSEADKAQCFTVHTTDIIIPGHILHNIDESGKTGPRSSALLEMYGIAGAFRVTGALDNTGPGLGSPHYRATGVV